MVRLKIADLARPQFKANPYQFYARLRAEAPVCQTKFLRQPTWLVTRYADVFAALKDERLAKEWPPNLRWLFRLAGPLQHHLLNQDAPDHTRLRALVHKAFTPHLVERMREQIQSVCDDLLNDLQVQGRMDLIRRYRVATPTHDNR